MAGGKAVVEAGAVTRRRVRCRAWLSRLGVIARAPEVIKRGNLDGVRIWMKGVTKLLSRWKVLKNLVCGSVLELTKLMSIAGGVRAANRRAAALHKAIVGKDHSRAGNKSGVEAIKEGGEPRPRNVRPPEGCKTGSKVERLPNWIVGVSQGERDACGIETLVACNGQHLLAGICG